MNLVEARAFDLSLTCNVDACLILCIQGDQTSNWSTFWDTPWYELPAIVY